MVGGTIRGQEGLHQGRRDYNRAGGTISGQEGLYQGRRDYTRAGGTEGLDDRSCLKRVVLSQLDQLT